MNVRPQVVIRGARRLEGQGRDFAFGAQDLPADALMDYRRAAWETYLRLPWPAAHEEAWRRTDMRALPVETFRLAAGEAARNLPLPPAALSRASLAGRPAGRLVLSPDGGRQTLADEASRQGVLFTDWRTAAREHPDLLRRLAGGLVRAEEGKFAALAAALAQDGVLLYVPKGVQVTRPLHSILWGPGGGLAYFSHVLVWVEDGGAVTWIHESTSPDEEADSLHAGLVEVWVGAGARLTLVELQAWGRHVWNVSHARVRVGRQGAVDWVCGATGSRLSKTFATLDLEEEGASGRMSGFYFVNGQQHLDYETRQNHLAPHTTSDLLFKGALADAGRAVWRGMIYVAPGAQKADGYQANRNLLLSPQARADSIPGLEICADDVRCTHGATVGRVEEEPLFYLQTRGIPRPEAEQLLVEGFFEPVMQRIPLESVRVRFQRAIAEKIRSRRLSLAAR
jgi:Fe-S cluster assembly protein SufD